MNLIKYVGLKLIKIIKIFISIHSFKSPDLSLCIQFKNDFHSMKLVLEFICFQLTINI